MTFIHPTAIVDPAAQLGGDVSVGPYSIVGPKVRLGDGVRVEAHAVIDGITEIGVHTRIFPFASVGMPPQDLKFHGEASRLVIGAHCMIREHVTLNPGTEGGGMLTEIGDHCLLMVGSHVAHDCRLGNHVILANNATLAGHVTVGDHAIIGGLSAVHQFVRIGQHAIIGGMSGIESDVIPYGSAMGERAQLAGLNLVGLKRRGFDRDTIHALRHAFKALFEHPDEGTFAERIQAVRETHGELPQIQEILTFLTADTSRAICQPKG
jgi:UDP-N-acetylglucosamine acyltransferase